MSQGDRHLFYVYCILERGAATGELASGAIAGVEPEAPLFAIEAGGLVAATSRVPQEVFCEEALNELLTDLPRLTPYAVRHEKAIREIFDVAQTVLPLTFGSVYLSADRVRGMLTDRAPELRSRLERLRGRQEWEVKIFQRPAVLLAAAATAATNARHAASGDTGPGRAYLLQRLQERWSVEEAGRMTAEMLRSIQSRLAGVSSATRIENAEGPTADDIELVCKVAALVPSSKTNDLMDVTNDLRQEYDPLGLSLELNGPWPAYSFVGDDNASG